MKGFNKNNRNKKYDNNGIKRENGKSKKKISKGLKTKLSNLEIKPQFLIIGLVAIITIISLIDFIFLKYSPFPVRRGYRRVRMDDGGRRCGYEERGSGKKQRQHGE